MDGHADAARRRFDSLLLPSASSDGWTRPWITGQGAHVTAAEQGRPPPADAARERHVGRRIRPRWAGRVLVGVGVGAGMAVTVQQRRAAAVLLSAFCFPFGCKCPASRAGNAVRARPTAARRHGHARRHFTTHLRLSLYTRPTTPGPLPLPLPLSLTTFTPELPP